MNESTKSISRWVREFAYHKYFTGDGIDIGCGIDSLWRWHHLFPLMKSCVNWDIDDGDAVDMIGRRLQEFDWINSSHCLEHLSNPFVALRRWIELLKVGGHAVILIPDEDMYEHGHWPSNFNSDHKWSFATSKASSWSPKSINVTKLLEHVNDVAMPIRMIRLEETFNTKSDPQTDQTQNHVAECAIEIVLRRVK